MADIKRDRSTHYGVLFKFSPCTASLADRHDGLVKVPFCDRDKMLWLVRDVTV